MWLCVCGPLFANSLLLSACHALQTAELPLSLLCDRARPRHAWLLSAGRFVCVYCFIAHVLCVLTLPLLSMLMSIFIHVVCMPAAALLPSRVFHVLVQHGVLAMLCQDMPLRWQHELVEGRGEKGGGREREVADIMPYVTSSGCWHAANRLCQQLCVPLRFS